MSSGSPLCSSYSGVNEIVVWPVAASGGATWQTRVPTSALEPKAAGGGNAPSPSPEARRVSACVQVGFQLLLSAGHFSHQWDLCHLRTQVLAGKT